MSIMRGYQDKVDSSCGKYLNCVKNGHWGIQHESRVVTAEKRNALADVASHSMTALFSCVNVVLPDPALHSSDDCSSHAEFREGEAGRSSVLLWIKFGLAGIDPRSGRHSMLQHGLELVLRVFFGAVVGPCLAATFINSSLIEVPQLWDFAGSPFIVEHPVTFRARLLQGKISKSFTQTTHLHIPRL